VPQEMQHAPEPLEAVFRVRRYDGLWHPCVTVYPFARFHARAIFPRENVRP
jgi:hypothetical protein